MLHEIVEVNADPLTAAIAGLHRKAAVLFSTSLRRSVMGRETCWHGQVPAAKRRVTRVERLLRPFDIDRTRARTAAPARRLCTALVRLRDYVDGQSAHLVNYHLRQRARLPIGTSTTEGLANTLVNRRMNKSQQMRWSVRGAHAVLAIRTAEVNVAMATTVMPLAA